MIVELVNECRGNTSKAAKEMRKPESLVKMALAYAAAYPDEIEASLQLYADRDFEGMKKVLPTLEEL